MADPKTEPPMLICDMEHYRAYGAERLLASLDSLTSEIKGVKGDDDIEFVHRMRVASRRLRSALGLFGECFEEEDVRRWNRAVRSVTRDLGEARDLDVQIAFLKDFVDSHEGRPSLTALMAGLEGRRATAQPRINSGLERLERKGALEQMRRTFEEVQNTPRCSVPYGTMERAFHHISLRLDELLSLQDCVHQPDAKERQHQMRIAAKRLRYTMEAFVTLYGEMMQGQIAVVKDLQDRLGELHDCDVWIDLLAAMGVDDPGLDTLQHDRMEARIVGYNEFVKIWESLIESEFFTELLNSIVPDATLALPQLAGMSKLEQVKAIAKGCGADEEHSLHVAELSLQLFDHLRSLHRLGDAEREMLEYAGVLHDIGWKEGQKGHHKNSLQMIMGEDRLPFGDRERAIVASVARYHRGVLPKEGHKAYRTLNSTDRKVVDRLASMIRVADALDVSHSSVVRSVECIVKKGSVTVILSTIGYPDRELEKVRVKKDLFEKIFNRALAFELD
ncbi:MAG TPA: CHAD domain-containing protein [Methanomassiliicoccales archaeon]|jgi:CHAD domain-containing protein